MPSLALAPLLGRPGIRFGDWLKFLDTDIKEIRGFSRDEKKQDDMRNAYRNVEPIGGEV